MGKYTIKPPWHHHGRQQPCWSLRCSWCIACRRCSNYIFIIDLTPGFSGLGKDNCKTRRETFKFWDLVHLVLEILQHYYQTTTQHNKSWPMIPGIYSTWTMTRLLFVTMSNQVLSHDVIQQLRSQTDSITTNSQPWSHSLDTIITNSIDPLLILANLQYIWMLHRSHLDMAFFSNILTRDVSYFAKCHLMYHTVTEIHKWQRKSYLIF